MTADGRLRVLHVVTALNAGGAETALGRLCTGLDPTVFESIIVTLADAGALRDQLRESGVRIETLGMRGRLPGLRSLWRLRALAAAIEPDVIHGWMPHGNMAALAASVTRPGTPVIWGIRQALYDLKHEPFLTRALIRAGAVLSSRTARCVYNSHVAMEHHERLGYRHERAAIIPNGFDTVQFAPNAQMRVSVRLELGLAHDAPIVLMLARVHPMKDHDTFLRAAAAVLAQAPATTFVLAGAGTGRGSALERTAQGHGLSRAIRMLGEREDTCRLAAAADIGVLSSYTESLPNALGELMASGVPCVATDVGDARRLVGETGRVVPVRAPEALAAAMLELLTMPLQERRGLGVRARQRIEEHYSLRTMVDAHATIYRSVARG